MYAAGCYLVPTGGHEVPGLHPSAQPRDAAVKILNTCVLTVIRCRFTLPTLLAAPAKGLSRTLRRPGDISSHLLLLVDTMRCEGWTRSLGLLPDKGSTPSTSRPHVAMETHKRQDRIVDDRIKVRFIDRRGSARLGTLYVCMGRTAGDARRGLCIWRSGRSGCARNVFVSLRLVHSATYQTDKISIPSHTSQCFLLRVKLVR